MEYAIDQNLLTWLDYIRIHAVATPDRHVAFDMARSIQWLLFDMVCHLCLGHPLGFIDQHEDFYGFQNVLETRLPIVEKFAIFTEVNTWIKMISHIPILRRVLPSPQDRDGIGAIMGVRYYFSSQIFWVKNIALTCIDRSLRKQSTPA